jgi:hypothetical protein
VVGYVAGAIVIAAIVALYISARRAITIAELVFDKGTVVVARGGVAPPILGDLRDIARTMPRERVRVRVLRERGRADVRFLDRVPDPDAQRIRNVVGSVPLARLVNTGGRQAR